MEVHQSHRTDAHVLNELIEKIVVHEKVVAADGSKSQQVDIYYKFIGCINRSGPPPAMPHRKKPRFRNIYHPVPKLPENDLGEPPGSGSPVIFCLQLVCEKPCQ